MKLIFKCSPDLMEIHYYWPWPVSGTKNTLEIVINATLYINKMHMKYQFLLTLWFILSVMHPKIFVRIKQLHLNWLNPHRACAKTHKKNDFLKLYRISLTNLCFYLSLLWDEPCISFFLSLDLIWNMHLFMHTHFRNI